jgi:hypothetical protein
MDARLAWRGEGEREPIRSLVRELVAEYERLLGNPDFKLKKADESLWAAVDLATLGHNIAMKRALRAVLRAEPYLVQPLAQLAIQRALDQFAAAFGVQGALVSCWGTARLINEKTRGQWVRKPRGFWWDELPLTFACLLTPRGPVGVAAAGLLVATDSRFSFTPHADDVSDFVFTSDQVESAEWGEQVGGTLRFKSDSLWERAEFSAGVPPVTAALHRAGLLKHDLHGVLGELLDEAVRDGSMDAATAEQIRLQGVLEAMPGEAAPE